MGEEANVFKEWGWRCRYVGVKNSFILSYDICCFLFFNVEVCEGALVWGEKDEEWDKCDVTVYKKKKQKNKNSTANPQKNENVFIKMEFCSFNIFQFVVGYIFIMLSCNECSTTTTSRFKKVIQEEQLQNKKEITMIFFFGFCWRHFWISTATFGLNSIASERIRYACISML